MVVNIAQTFILKRPLINFYKFENSIKDGLRQFFIRGFKACIIKDRAVVKHRLTHGG